jgi:HEPN domain-containing protein
MNLLKFVIGQPPSKGANKSSYQVITVKPETLNWLKSADYDLESARFMLKSDRFLYVVFLCHLTLEKTFKALVCESSPDPAPRTHDLIYLVKRTGIGLTSQNLEFIGKINNASIPTRYPEDIQEAIKEYNREIATAYLEKTEEVVSWLKADPRLTS